MGVGLWPWVYHIIPFQQTCKDRNPPAAQGPPKRVLVKYGKQEVGLRTPWYGWTMLQTPGPASWYLQLLPSAPPKWVAKKANHGQGPKYDEQGFGVTCGDELLVFSLDRFAGMSWLNG